MKKLLSVLLSLTIILSCVSMIKFDIKAEGSEVSTEIKTEYDTYGDDETSLYNLMSTPMATPAPTPMPTPVPTPRPTPMAPYIEIPVNEHSFNNGRIFFIAGETVRLSVDIGNNPGISSADIKISYDSDALILENVSNGGFFKESEWEKCDINQNPYILSFETQNSENIITASGTLVFLDFKVSATAETGNHYITLSYNEGDIIDANSNPVNFNLVNGEVRIDSIDPGTVSPPTSGNNDIYYSDLFYGYDTSYFLDEGSLKLHIKQTSNILADTYNEFADSSEGFWAAFKTGFNMSVDAMFKLDFREYVKLMSDTYGSTNYIYTNALDNANKVFAEELIKPEYTSMAGRASAEFGMSAKVASRAKAILELYDEFQDRYDPNQVSKVEIFNIMFDWLRNSGVFHYIGEAHIDEIEDIVLADVEKFTDFVGASATALEAAESIFFAIMLEDVRMEIVSDIVANAPTDSCLYDGMSRLKKQLSNGFVSYFVDNYLKDATLDFIFEKVTKPLVKSLEAKYSVYDVMGDILSVGSWVAFDVIFDIPDLGDMTTQKVLTDYSSDLYDVVKSKISSFDKQFTASDVENFESMFDAYVAATNAALKESRKLALDSNSPELEGIIYVWKDYGYSKYIEYTINTIKQIPAAERKVKFFEEWINPSGTFKNASDSIEDGFIYLFNGALNANVKYTKITTIQSENNIQILIKGNAKVDNAQLTISENLNVTIEGNLEINSGYGYDSRYEYCLVNNGCLNVQKSIICNGLYKRIDTYTYDLPCKIKNNGIIQNFIEVNFNKYAHYEEGTGARLIVIGNLNIVNFTCSNGTVEFIGTEQQTVRLSNAYNIVVTNPKGIKYLRNLSLYGKYNLNGNPLELNGCCTYLCGNSELDNSDFQEIKINNDYILDYNIKGNVTVERPSSFATNVSNIATVTIPEGENVIIDGNLKTVDDCGAARIQNNGTLTCNGDADFGTGVGKNYLPSKDSKMILKKNLVAFQFNEDICGTIEFAGTEQQKAYLPSAYNIVVTNPKGIKYLRNLFLYGEYNLNGNPLDLNGYYTYLCGNSKLDNSDFQEIRIDNLIGVTDYTLDYNIKGNVTIFSPSISGKTRNVTIPAGANVIIDGDLKVGSDYSSTVVLHNNGTLTCLGDVEFYKHSTGYQNAYLYENKYSSSEDAKLILKKNLIDFAYWGSVCGTIEIAGTERQEINLNKAYIVEISNGSSEGVVFTSKILVNKLFDHKGNKFTLYNNGLYSTFVDYDGDGLRDNVDPQPIVAINEIGITHISVTTKPTKCTYLEGDDFDKTGMVVTAYYDNNTSYIVTGYTISGYTSTPGTKTITVNYEGKTDTFTVEVTAKSLTSIVVTTKPNKLTYLEGDSFYKTGMIVTAYYNNNTRAVVTDYTVSGYTSTPGTKTITVTYGDKTATFTVEVEAVVVAQDGWVQENGIWVYYENGIKLTNTWKEDSVGWCYLTEDGSMATNQWIKDSVGWCYVGSDGYCVTDTWMADSVGWCYLNSEGRMATNTWILDSVGWCYVGSDGYCVTDCWMADSVGWVYLDSEGRMKTNAWVMDSVGWCYVGSDGYAVTNCWMADSTGWCYLDANGRMVINDYVYDSNGKCWLDADGYWDGTYR